VEEAGLDLNVEELRDFPINREILRLSGIEINPRS